ncbi:MAG: peptidylprolyl isomerase [Saprospiraceae bacterium]
MKLIKSIFFLSMLALAFSACNTDNHTYVIIETEYGNMKAMLYDQTPQHKANFIKLVKKAIMTCLMFHRVIPNFMIQGGDPDSNANQTAALGMGGPGYTIPAEFVFPSP